MIDDFTHAVKYKLDLNFIRDTVHTLSALNSRTFLTLKADIIENLFAFEDIQHVGRDDTGRDLLFKGEHPVEVKSGSNLLRPRRDRKDKNVYTNWFVAYNSRTLLQEVKQTNADAYVLVDTTNHLIGVAKSEDLVLSERNDQKTKMACFPYEKVQLVTQTGYKPTIVEPVDNFCRTIKATASLVQEWKASYN